MSAGSLYRCRIMHNRPRRPRYRFVYRSYYLLVDIDRLDALGRRLPILSHNRRNWLALHDADHGPHDGSPLRPWLEGLLAEHDVELEGGCIRMLAMPRVAGYGFNPLSLFYCEHADSTLRAVVAEVHNTFGEHHFYVLHEQGAPMSWRTSRIKSKRFHVSPFMDRSGAYQFHFLEPAERLGVGIRLFDGEDGELRLTTTLTGEQRELTTAQLLRVAITMPLMPLKVMAAIHWQALKLWWRGAVFHRKPDPQRPNVS